MRFSEAFDAIRWRIEGCIIRLWLRPLFVRSKAYPLKYWPVPKPSYWLIRLLYVEDFCKP